MDKPIVIKPTDKWHYITAYRLTWQPDNASSYLIIGKGTHYTLSCNGQEVDQFIDHLDDAKQAARDHYALTKAK